jgi:hypothetical protein
MNCPYKDCASTDILRLFVVGGPKALSRLDGKLQTAYCKCLACGKYFKHVSFCAPLGPSETREAMTAEVKAHSGCGMAAGRVS